MEKHQESKAKEQTPEDFQIQDPGGDDLKMDLDDFQLKDQVQNSKGSIQNVSEQDIMKNTEKPFIDKGLQKEDVNTEVKRKNERPAEKCLVREQDLMQQTQLEADAIDKSEEFSGDKVPESEKNTRIHKGAKEISITSGQNLLPIVNCDSNKEGDKTAKLAILSSNNGALQNPCEVSEENVKVTEEQETKTHQKSAMPNEISEMPVEFKSPQYDPQVEKPTQREQELRDIVANFFSNKNLIIQQETEVSYQRDSKNFNSQKIKLQTTISGEPGDNRNVCPQELGGNLIKYRSEYEDGVLAISRESKKDATEHHSAAKTKKMEYGSTLPFDHGPKVPQSSKEYVTFPKQKSDITSLQNMDYSSDVPGRSDDGAAYFKKTKDYVTCKPNMRSRPLRTRGYVTHRPQFAEPVTVVHKPHKDFSRRAFSHIPKPKNYVTVPPIKQIVIVSAPEPPTHVLWSPRKPQETSSGPELPADTACSARSRQENASHPKPSTQTHKPPQSLPESTSEAKESDPMQLGTEQIKEKKASPSLLKRTRCQQALVLQPPTHSPLPEDDEFPLMPFEEVCCDSETEEPLAQGSSGTLSPPIPPLSAGEQGFVPNVTPERQRIPVGCIRGCTILFCSLLVGVVMYFAIMLAVNKHGSIASNFATTLPDSRFNMNISMIDVKQNRPSESLDGKVSNPLSITKINSNDTFTTPSAEFEVNTTGSLARLEIETISLYDSHFNMSIPMTDVKQYHQSESLDGKVSNLRTRMAITKIDSNDTFTTPFSEINDNITDSLARLEIETITPYDSHFNMNIPNDSGEAVPPK